MLSVMRGTLSLRGGDGRMFNSDTHLLVMSFFLLKTFDLVKNPNSLRSRKVLSEPPLTDRLFMDSFGISIESDKRRVS